ncbi:MAG: type II toxin-antitoxin system HicB family antitoxin [Nanoarchaeota archaeon]|nr:type II toxin-antitoxin system HicB family antitoxin [Nanoarchaeota archaeon]
MANNKRIAARFAEKKCGVFSETGFDLPVIITKENGTIVSHIPFFFIGSQGNTVEESIENLKDAVELYFDGENVKELIMEKLPAPPSIEIMKISSAGKVVGAPFISIDQ